MFEKAGSQGSYMLLAAASFAAMAIAQLKEVLAERKLPLDGPKPCLQKRLHAAILIGLRGLGNEDEV